MDQNFKRFVDLFRKALSESLAKDEQEEFDVLLQDPAIREVYRDMQDPDYLTERLSPYLLFPSEKAYRKFERRFGKKYIARKLFTRWSVAATVLILIGVAAGVLTTREKEMKRIEIPSNTIISPGMPQARLKLADGRKIEVTRANEGEINEQGGTLIQFEEGKLTYHHTGQTASAMVYNELSVPLGGECYVVLEDGSKVWMNAGSVLKYPICFGDTIREINLEGEAYFEIERDVRPFVVRSKLGDVRVLGTTFGITAYPGENMLTTLVSGKVAFEQDRRNPVTITPGEQIVAYPSGKIERKTVEPEEYVGWKNGIYVFKDRKLEEIMLNLERWYNVKVFYQSQQMKDVHFTGNVLRYDTINAFLEILEGTGDVKYRINGNTVILYQ